MAYARNQQETESTDDELVDLCVQGDKEAYAQLVERHKRMVFNFAYRVLGDAEDAEDALQDIFLRAYLALPRFRGESKFSTWLYRIASNVCVTHRQKRAVDEELMGTRGRDFDKPDVEMADSADTPEEVIVKSEFSKRVQELVASLPTQYSIVITLRYFNEFTYEEIAETLGLTLGNVKTRLFRAKEMLKELAMKRSLFPEET